jgi:hypothetical protein
MSPRLLTRVTPNEQFQVILEFADAEYRIFDMSVLCNEEGWSALAYPQNLKRFTFSEAEVSWSIGGTVSASYLYERSKPIGLAQLDHQVLRLSFKNQAPTDEDKHHHEYAVYLAPFSEKLFRVGESIGGGMADRGGARNLSIVELLDWPQWKQHFELAGCAWAIGKIEPLTSKPQELLSTLIDEACQRNGMPED